MIRMVEVTKVMNTIGLEIDLSEWHLQVFKGEQSWFFGALSRDGYEPYQVMGYGGLDDIIASNKAWLELIPMMSTDATLYILRIIIKPI